MNQGPQNDVLEFMHWFRQGDCTLTLQGKSFTKEDCTQLGEGSEKTIFGIKGEEHCFFVPTKNPNWWDLKIKEEKELCDQILSVGIRAQQFEIVPLELQNKWGAKFTMNVLVSKRFDYIAKDESVVIYNPKGAPNPLTGQPFTVYDNVKRLQDKEWNLKIIKEIIKEYAIAYTFKLPIHQVNRQLDDSVHFYIQLPKNEKEPPVFHYMFWDVRSDFDGIEPPVVPTLKQLKKGLKSFVNEVACAYCGNEDECEKFGFAHSLEAIRPFENALLDAITDEVLMEAIAAAEKSAAGYLEKLNPQKPAVTYLPAFAAIKAAKDNNHEKLMGEFFQKYGLGEPNENVFLAVLRIFKDPADRELLFGAEFDSLLKPFNVVASKDAQGPILERGLAAVEAKVGKDLKMTDEVRTSLIKQLVQTIYQKIAKSLMTNSESAVKQGLKAVSH